MDAREFTPWGWGRIDLAAAGGQLQAYETARRVVVDLRDRDDGAVSPEEQRDGIAAAFAYADRDGDGALTEDEHLGGFITGAGLRNALTAR